MASVAIPFMKPTVPSPSRTTNLNSTIAPKSTRNIEEENQLEQDLKDREEQSKQLRKELDKQINDQTDEIQSSQLFTDLSSYIRRCWSAALQAKQEIQEVLYESSLQRQGRYTDEKLEEIGKISSSTIFMNVTNVKCRAAESWLRDIASSVNDKMWNIEPTVLPSLSPELSASISQYIQQQITTNPYLATFESQKELYDYLRKEVGKVIDKDAHDIATRMERKIEDQLEEAKWDNTLDVVRADIVTYKAGILKFPVVRKKRVLKWVQDPQQKKWIPKQVFDVVMDCDRVSPFDLYPSPYSTTIDDGYLFEVHRLTRQDLIDMIDIPGYDEASIRTVLNTYPNGYKVSHVHSDRWLKENAENREPDRYDKVGSPLETLEFWGTVPGRLLLDWGMKSSEIPDPDVEYQANVWIVDTYIIKAVLNKNLDGKKPYYKTSFENVPGSFWGRGIPEIIKDIQDVCNATARALVNNLAISSGPQVITDTSKLKMGSDVEDMYPFKVWYYDSENSNWSSSVPAIDFFQPDSNSGELLHVYNEFSAKADDHTGIPPYVYGSTDVGGAGRALANYEKILTPNGMVEIGNINRGDLVCNSYGSFSKVINVYPQGESDIFRIKFSNDEHVDCDINHRWSVKSHHDRKFRTLTTGEILKKGLFRKTKIDDRNPKGYRPKWMLPFIDFVEFNKKEVKIDPYTMGVLIGDGDSRCRVTSMDKEIFDRIPYTLGKIDRKKHDRAYARTVKGIKLLYHSYGLNCKSINKFIPDDYLYNSREVRLELLRGLMDTDGCGAGDGRVFFSSSSYRLINDFRKLVKSLGATVNLIREEVEGNFEIKGRKCFRQKNYRLVFSLPGEKIFHLERKQNKVSVKQNTYIYITGIEYIGKYPATCISVDSMDSLFVCSNFILTHNTASGLSMLMTNAAKGIKYVVANIDRDIIEPAITTIYNFNMLFDPDDSIKGDLCVVAKGVLSLISKEQLQIRRMEFLNIIANSPTYLGIVGKKGAAYLLREGAKTLDIDTSKIIPDEEELERMEEMEQKIAQQQQAMSMMQQSGQPTQLNGTTPNIRNISPSGEPVQGTDTATMMNRDGFRPG